jgi:hypothetical protein
MLTGNEKESFHSLVANLLYMANRGRPDIVTAVRFFTTRVKTPNQAIIRNSIELGHT